MLRTMLHIFKPPGPIPGQGAELSLVDIEDGFSETNLLNHSYVD